MNEKCENDISACSQRHPKVCIYYREYNRCKFSDRCVYTHVVKDNGLEKLKIENERILQKICDLEKVIVEKCENRNNNSLERKLEVVERKLENFLTLEKQIFDKDNLIAELDKKLKEIESRIFNLEEARIEKEVSCGKGRKKCDKCDFETDSERGLKVHASRKHTTISNNKYPKTCDLCDKKLKIVKE